MKLRTWLSQTRQDVEPVIERGERHWFVKLMRNYLDDDPDALASMLAFSAMFSLMPILIVTFLVLTIFLRITVIENQILDLIADDVPLAVREAVEQIFSSGSSNSTLIGVMTVVTFLLGGARLYNAMDRACALVFHSPRRSMVRRRLFTLLAMPLIPLLLLAATIVAVTATAALMLPLERMFDVNPSNQQAGLIYLSAFLLAFGMLLLAYWRIPTVNPGLRVASEAAVVTAVLVVLLAQFFPLYIELTGGFNLYGSLFGFILLILLWLYLIGHIFVIGAEIAAYRSGRRRRDEPGTQLRANDRPVER